MRPGIYGKKVGMTQIFDENGAVVPVTVIDASECVITQIKTKQTDGYNAIQVGYGFRKLIIHQPIFQHGAIDTPIISILSIKHTLQTDNRLNKNIKFRVF